jgi:hypothetical protein
MAADRLATAATITMVGDRESDIYDLFARRPANVHLLCRLAHPRAMTTKSSAGNQNGLPCRLAHPRAMTTGGLLPEHCASLPEQGRETIDVPPKGSQRARQATVALRFDAISLKRPVQAGCSGMAQGHRALGG